MTTHQNPARTWAHSDVDLAWLAGLLEGEGCFTSGVDSAVKTTLVIKVHLAMTDLDVVERAAKFMEGATVIECAPRKLQTKTVYRVTRRGYSAARIMRWILPFMGARRSAKIQECLAVWDNRPIKNREKFLPPQCHPDRAHHSRGFCYECYKSDEYTKTMQRRARNEPLPGETGERRRELYRRRRERQFAAASATP